MVMMGFVQESETSWRTPLFVGCVVVPGLHATLAG